VDARCIPFINTYNLNVDKNGCGEIHSICGMRVFVLHQNMTQGRRLLSVKPAFATPKLLHI